jgi:hypothetical protein
MFLNSISEIGNGQVVAFLEVGRSCLSSCVFVIEDSARAGFRVLDFRKEAIGMVDDQSALKYQICLLYTSPSPRDH